MKPIYTIFYSWESDLSKDTNLNGIRQALREASSLIENEIDDMRIVLDEATRNTYGSPNIPDAIIDKIIACDIFIGDLTTINSNSVDEIRRVPNPNVLIELGFAIATLGWDRIIVLFNTNYGTFPTDLPFDIDKRRASPFSIQDKKDKLGKNQLAQVLKVAIQAIIEKAPLKPNEKRSETIQQRKRRIDVSKLRWVMNAIHIPTIDQFIEEMPERIISRILYFKDSFSSILDSNLFHIYDPELLGLLTKFKKSWIESLSFTQYYSSSVSGKYLKFYMPMDMFPSKQAEKDFNKLVKIRSELKENFKKLLLFIRNNYLEIDIEETNKNAFESYKNDLEKEILTLHAEKIGLEGTLRHFTVACTAKKTISG